MKDIKEILDMSKERVELHELLEVTDKEFDAMYNYCLKQFEEQEIVDDTVKNIKKYASEKYFSRLEL